MAHTIIEMYVSDYVRSFNEYKFKRRFAMSNIKRSVSMYSFQDQFARGKWKLEDIFSYLVDVGADMEFISDQMMHQTPNPTKETLENWDELLKKYPVKPVCNDIFINTNLFRNRTLTKKESIQALKKEIELAKRLGFPLIRLVSLTPSEIIEPVYDFAKEAGVTMALEIHAGMSFDNPKTKEFLDVMYKLGPDYLGLVIDTGIFCRRHPRVSTEYFRKLGTNENVIRYIDDVFASGTCPKRLYSSMEDMPQDLRKLFTNPIDEEYAFFASGYETEEFSILDEFMPYIKHFHGKIFEMTEEGVEYSVPFDELVQYLHEKDYNGYISTEYEGNRFTLPGEEMKEVEQVTRHQNMLKKYIDELG